MVVRNKVNSEEYRNSRYKEWLPLQGKASFLGMRFRPFGEGTFVTLRWQRSSYGAMPIKSGEFLPSRTCQNSALKGAKESCPRVVSLEAFCHKSKQIEVPGEWLASRFCWMPANAKAKHWRSFKYWRSWLAVLCYKTAQTRVPLVTAGH